MITLQTASLFRFIVKLFNYIELIITDKNERKLKLNQTIKRKKRLLLMILLLGDDMLTLCCVAYKENKQN